MIYGNSSRRRVERSPRKTIVFGPQDVVAIRTEKITPKTRPRNRGRRVDGLPDKTIGAAMQGTSPGQKERAVVKRTWISVLEESG